MDMNGTPRQVADVIWRVLDGNAVLVSPEGGKVTTLNAAGTKIWSLIDGQNSGLDIAREVVRQYDVSDHQAQQDVENFLTKLERRGLLEWD